MTKNENASTRSVQRKSNISPAAAATRAAVAARWTVRRWLVREVANTGVRRDATRGVKIWEVKNATMITPRNAQASLLKPGSDGRGGSADQRRIPTPESLPGLVPAKRLAAQSHHAATTGVDGRGARLGVHALYNLRWMNSVETRPKRKIELQFS